MAAMAVWIIGIPSSGKTRLVETVYKILKTRSKNWILLDEEMIIDIAGLSREFVLSGSNIVANVPPVDSGMQKNNKETIPGYRDIYIKDGIDFHDLSSPDIVIENVDGDPDFTDLAFDLIRMLNISFDEEYEYIRGNKLKSPYKYEFSKYEGSFFLETYSRSRDDVIGAVKKNLEKLSITKQACGKLVTDHLKNCTNNHSESSDNIHTVSALSTILLRYGSNVVSPEDMRILMILLKKFEVSKRLFEMYCLKNGKYLKVPGDYDNIFAYLLFANSLSCAIITDDDDKGSDLPQKTIMLNTLLKINDTISSVLYMVCSPVELALALRAFVSEKEILRKFAERVL